MGACTETPESRMFEVVPFVVPSCPTLQTLEIQSFKTLTSNPKSESLSPETYEVAKGEQVAGKRSEGSLGLPKILYLIRNGAQRTGGQNRVNSRLDCFFFWAWNCIKQRGSVKCILHCLVLYGITYTVLPNPKPVHARAHSPKIQESRDGTCLERPRF